MKSLQLIYEDKKQFNNFLMENSFDYESDCLVRIYVSNHSKEEAVEVSKAIQNLLPNSKIIGCSANGIIYHGKQYESDILVVIEKHEKTNIIKGKVVFEDKTTVAVAKEIKQNIEGKNISLMHMLIGNQWTQAGIFLDDMNTINPGVKLAGGIAGNNMNQDVISFVFDEDEAFEAGLIYAGYSNDDLKIFTMANISHEPISSVYTINEAKDTYLETIEGVPATDWCFEQFGLRRLKEYKKWQQIAEDDELVKFPLIIENSHGLSRFIHYDSTLNKMSLYSSTLPSNTRFRIGYVSPTRCVKECHDICTEVSKNSIEALFCYTCVFRKLYLENCADWELKPFANCNISGAFMLGEIGWNIDRNSLYNGSCCYVGLAENENYFLPDFSVFDNLFHVHTDDDKLLNFVLKKQSLAMTEMNQQLLDKLLMQQEKSKSQLYLDTLTGLPNTLKYAIDKSKYNFNKMCMIQIENSNLLVSRFGQEGYHQILKEGIKCIQEDEELKRNPHKFYCYALNDTTILVTAATEVNDDEFMAFIEYLFEHYHTMEFSEFPEILINRFILVHDDKELLEKGIIALKECQFLQSHFINYSEVDMSSSESLQKEQDMLNILNYALNHDGIIPYFQGIYDNEAKQVGKYEALMRIRDSEGNIYVPSDFMEIAKKYHLYTRLSMVMIGKVLELFEGTGLDVALNLSAYDINYKTVNSFIIDKLSKMKDCSNFVFEILEDESFKDISMLQSFLAKVRKFKVRIAIDDFGIGYSNFISIAQIAPDFIKIDGGIVRNIKKDIIYRKVLENIVFLGKQLDAKIVAEFVEDKTIQEEVEKYNIHYSQGYYFARPVPFEMINFEPFSCSVKS